MKPLNKIKTSIAYSNSTIV